MVGDSSSVSRKMKVRASEDLVNPGEIGYDS